MKQSLNFQSIIMTLQDYWAKQGCLIWHPYYTQVGAGTMNPATFLRVLGPEPWNVAYLEPSIRPDDGRYGENPNRLQQFYQFQVILKPDPGNAQELYLRSLEALGINPRQHDIRFVEDNWEQPAIGAWGLGWEVWLDGMEITQFTYFQQAGGITLEPVSVEITYGLERIAMTLQGVKNFRDLRWNDQRTDGDVNLQGEVEHSRYYFDLANVERLHQMYDLFEAEARLALDNGLVLPALDYILKCSHTFNVLDTRGAVGVTERQAIFGRTREMSHRLAEIYVAQRQSLEFPWLENKETITRLGTASATAGMPKFDTQQSTPRKSGKAAAGHFLLEIGSEELPNADLSGALEQLKTRVPVLLDDLRLPHGEIRVLGTPRRLVVDVKDLAERQPDRESLFKGPPASRAFDALGVATKAAEGFARSKGLEVSDLKVQEIDGGSYAVAVVHEAGKSAGEVLAGALPGLVAGLRFEKTMRWNSSNVAYSRPLRWIVALLGGEVIPFEYAGLQSGRVTYGLRFYEPAEHSSVTADDYFDYLAGQGILLDPQERKQRIRAQVSELMLSAGGEEKLDEDLLSEVTNLVEAPTALLGRFDPARLELPAEVLVSVMKKHQRYFPVQTSDGQLRPNFIAVRNGDAQSLELVADGNEQVLGARYADAAFFIQDDLKHALEDFLPRLGTLTFQKKLGSMLDKTKRIEALVEKLLPFVEISEEEKAVTLRTAHLCKADLVSHMVVEMTSLQGVMGRFYAQRSGEKTEVAQAIAEHYLPRFSGDTQPKTKAALLVGLADRLDSLMGLFAADLAPSGTKDPFALRRAALGLALELMSWNQDFDLRSGLALAAESLPVTASPEAQKACLEFIIGRLRAQVIDQGARYDVVDAVLAAQGENPAGAARAVKILGVQINAPDWNSILPAYARCVRITRDQKETFVVQPDLLVDPSEKELYQAVEKAEKTPHKAGSMEDFFTIFLPLIPTINRFFEAVLVMAEDAQVRANRLGLLQRLAHLADGVVDFSLLEGF